MTRYLIEVWDWNRKHTDKTHRFDLRAESMTTALELVKINEEIDGRECRLYCMTEVKFSEED